MDFTYSPPRRSMPIKIPPRQKSPQTIFSPKENLSPELVFEMSPLDVTPPHSTNYSYLAQDQEEPPLYAFPILSPKPRCNPSHCCSPPTRRTAVLGRAFSPALRELARKPKSYWPHRINRPTSIAKLAVEKQQPVVRTGAVHKVKGFEPLFETQNIPTFASDNARPLQQITPPPSAFTASPWILPGNADRRDESVVDTCTHLHDFDKYLLRRIEEKSLARPLRAPSMAAL